MALKGKIKIDTEKCKGCALCIEVCPVNTLSMSKEVNDKGYYYPVVVNDACTGCANCGLICPDGVIEVYREKKKKKA